MRRFLFSSLFVFTASAACVTVPNTRLCTVVGSLSQCTLNDVPCAVCADTQTSNTARLKFPEFIDFIEAEPERPDPDHAGEKLPEHASAVFMSAEAWNGIQTALEEACRSLGSKCKPEVGHAIHKMNDLTHRLTKAKDME